MTGARDLAIRFDLNAMASLGCVACRVYTFKMLQYIWRDMYVHILISQSMCWWIFEVSSIHFPWMVNFFTLCWCFILILYTFIVLSLAWNQSGIWFIFLGNGSSFTRGYYIHWWFWANICYFHCKFNTFRWICFPSCACGYLQTLILFKVLKVLCF